MNDTWLVILCLAVGTFAIRLTGFVIGTSLPAEGAWARALKALPGCLIAALLTVILMQGQWPEWGAAVLSFAAAIVTRSLPLTMLAGVGSVWLLRSFL